MPTAAPPEIQDQQAREGATDEECATGFAEFSFPLTKSTERRPMLSFVCVALWAVMLVLFLPASRIVGTTPAAETTHRAIGEWIRIQEPKPETQPRQSISRRIVGRSMGRWISRYLVVDAPRMAMYARQQAGLLIRHLDRGGHYASEDFARHGERSMSSYGNGADDAAVEAFFRSLSRERVNRVRHRTWDGACADAFDASACSATENGDMVTPATSAGSTSRSSQRTFAIASRNGGKRHQTSLGKCPL